MKVSGRRNIRVDGGVTGKIGTSRVEIDPVIINMPDFNDRVTDWFSCRTEKTTCDVCNPSCGGD